MNNVGRTLQNALTVARRLDLECIITSYKPQKETVSRENKETGSAHCMHDKNIWGKKQTKKTGWVQKYVAKLVDD